MMEAYRSGHNGPDSKSGSPHGLVGSNPTASAKKDTDMNLLIQTGVFFFTISYLLYNHDTAIVSRSIVLPFANCLQ